MRFAEGGLEPGKNLPEAKAAEKADNARKLQRAKTMGDLGARKQHGSRSPSSTDLRADGTPVVVPSWAVAQGPRDAVEPLPGAAKAAALMQEVRVSTPYMLALKSTLDISPTIALPSL